ncbi:MAG TPA: bifunctional DNA-formamidopyrimidine glycosylase/DNA-(apurinic or apyrimidinic site) lyase [Patescibacteria group bacterium]|jgi:formamidopyrimidine-DNA glycosylase|nr:bifunctional DNA-formamidopyrimidine glycosylase/DNA-(apurinic or apyrimidinic site) lyase [Patescibacteria group bacterium]
MPELPEVETIRLGLNKYIIGKRVKAVDYDWPKGFPNKPEDVKKHLLDATIVAIRRRAKVLIIDLSTKYSLVIHLKMTGQLVYRSGKAAVSSLEHDSRRRRGTDLDALKYIEGSTASQQRSSVPSEGAAEAFGGGHPTDSLTGQLPDRSTRVTFSFEDDSKLFFNDQRKFGWVRLLPTLEVEQLDFFKKVGPEPLEASFTDKDFIQRIRRRIKSGIKAVLLDQTVIAGIGNIYADESLFAAKIHPSTLVKNLTDVKLTELYKALREVLQKAIQLGGSTDRNYVDAEGKRGSYLKFAQVFRREGQSCLRCGGIITKIRVAGRGTHLCLNCQPLVQ